MGNKMSLTEATMLALQGKLVENKLSLSELKAKVEESINVNVDETTNINVDETSISVDETTTVVETPEATIIIEEPQPEIVEPIEEPTEEIVELIDEETPEELEENKEECSKCVRLTLDGKIYWEGTEEEFKADEEGLKLMACDIYEEDTGATRDADEVNVEYVDCLEECKETEETVEEKVEESKKLQEEISEETINLAYEIAEEIEKVGCMRFDEIQQLIIEKTGITFEEMSEKQLDNDIYGCLTQYCGLQMNFSTGDIFTPDYAENNPDVLEESKLEEVKDITPKTEKTFLEDLKFIKELGGFDDNFKTSQKAKEILNKLSDDELAQLAFDFSNKPEHHDLTSLYYAYIFGLESKIADLDSTSEDVKEDVKEEAIEEPIEETILEEKKSLKFNAKSFNESLTKYFKANYKTVENIQINKVGINDNGIKVEAKLTSVDAKERTICLEMNKVSSAKSFAKYTLKEATGLLKENKQNVDKLTMMTFTNKDNVLECKYLICK